MNARALNLAVLSLGLCAALWWPSLVPVLAVYVAGWLGAVGWRLWRS